MIKVGIVFYGAEINEYNINNGIETVHAEVNACLKVKRTFNKKKVNICVYRTNKKGTKLMCSKPCLGCLRKTHRILSYKNYQIHRFYWFNEKGDIQFYNRNEINSLIT